MSLLEKLEEEILASAGTLDVVPNAFTITDQTGVPTSTLITFAAVTVAGLGGGVSILYTASGGGGTIDKNGDNNFQTTQTLANGDTFRPQHMSSASPSTPVNTTVTGGGVSDTATSTTAAFSPIDVDYTTGSGVETVPSGATTLVISVNGIGGNGQQNPGIGAPGNGGGGGGNSVKTLSVSGGQTFNWNATANPKTVTNGTGPSVSLSVNGGANGSAGAAGGTASGGDTNVTGGPGSSPVGGASFNGGGIQTTLGAAGNFPGGGGAGNTAGGGAGGTGALGRIRFSYS